MPDKPEPTTQDADEAIDLFDQLTRQNDDLRAEQKRLYELGLAMAERVAEVGC